MSPKLVTNIVPYTTDILRFVLYIRDSLERSQVAAWALQTA
ncbi:hypothetical protein [Arthrobacter psychrochitiniphilus]